ncbi:hypothetical protein C3942_02380 [Solimonas fluminis]|uniref:DUF4124 domain-containing protein n=1 Tax=Solimonas fluminis TaxID=2086571 RepID=A0A2S5TL87_9GAMM|nr:DUF4124 domain-containing protein [Solimonas fluminis]PPE75760.1 hypothetical protein C3942_02380 [Solimonas fluminis]
MRHEHCSWLIPLLLLAMPAGAQVYRCENPGKPTVYQDKPCAGARGGTVTLPPLSVVPSQPAAETPAAPPAAAAAGKASAAAAGLPPAPAPAEVRAAIIANRVLPGMKADEVLAAAGRHTDHYTEQGLDADGRYELWTFSRRLDSFPFVVKLRHGVVVETRER